MARTNILSQASLAQKSAALSAGEGETKRPPARRRSKKRPKSVLTSFVGRGARGKVQEKGRYVDEINADIITLGTTYRAVLEVSSVNFALKDPDEQEMIIAGYKSFLNGLGHPIQIMVRILPFDLEDYANGISTYLHEETNATLLQMGQDHLAFVRRLTQRRNLLYRKFYLIVPFNQEDLHEHKTTTTAGVYSLAGVSRAFRRIKGMLWPAQTSRQTQEIERSSVVKQLNYRCDEIIRSLAGLELKSRRLDTRGIVELYYSFLCPDISRVQKLRLDLEDYTIPVVRGQI